MSRTVYVATSGMYSDMSVSGVYDSPERAMAAQDPKATWTRSSWTHFPNWPDRTVVEHSVDWTNGEDWQRYVRIFPIELIDEGSLHEVDVALVQTYRESDGGWDYLPDLAGSAVEAAVLETPGESQSPD